MLGTIKSTIDKFLNKEVDEVYIVYNKFKNTVTQTPIIEKILPNATISIIYLGIVEKIICLAVKFKKFFCAEEKVFL